MHQSPPPGLLNLRNTCYLNAALQAMATSAHFTACIASLACAFEATATPESPSHDTLWQLAAAAWRFLWHGPADDDDPEALSQQQLVAQAAQGRLTRALHAVLSQLQPPSDTTHHARAVHPGAVLSCLSCYVPVGVLEAGEQQDAAEALELLLDAVGTELTCWHQLHGRSWQQHGTVGLQALLRQPQQHLDQDSTSAAAAAAALAAAAAAAVAVSGTHPVLQLQQSCRPPTSQPPPPQQQQQQQARGVVAGIPLRLPVVGSCSDAITCLECGDRFPCAVSPFMVLPLSLPHTRLRVPQGTMLSDCLRRYCATEILHGVECTRCSIRAALKQQQEQQQQQQKHQQEQQEQQHSVTDMLTCLCASQQPLPPLDYPQLLQQQWVPRRCAVLKQTVPRRAPAVLLLQLQRSAHIGGLGGGKIQGWVSFPLQLDWSAVVCAAAAAGEQQQQQATIAASGNLQLVAVVQHLGAAHSSGHYIMFRRVEQQQRQHSTINPAGGGGCCDSSSGQSEGTTGSSQWFRVSDARVSPVSEQEVLQCHATLLVYERQA